jgi:hypothetical protein
MGRPTGEKAHSFVKVLKYQEPREIGNWKKGQVAETLIPFL